MKKRICITALLLLNLYLALGQTDYTPSPENLENRAWFQDAKFGLFIHWGVYTTLGDGEWVMQQQKIKTDRYELLPDFFNPQQFNAKAWVKLAKAAGMKYITITTKHHDGFAMYDSKFSDYNIVDDTPYGKDIFRLLEEACKKEGIKLFAYYSQLDWHHPDYYPRGKTGQDLGRPESGNWQDYIRYQNAQIKELAENYDIAGFWFDGYWDQNDLKKAGKPYEDFDLEATYKIIHGVNSGLLIGNNHHLAPIAGEDFQMFEKDLPGKNTAGFSEGSQIGNLPLETCETINHSWGFNLQDGNHKSFSELIQYLIKAAGNNANFLLNVGPMPNGKIQQEHQDLLMQMGSWLQENGESIYDTRGGMFQGADYVSTEKNQTTYLHVLNTDLNTLSIPFAKKRIKTLSWFDDGKPVKYKIKKNVLTIYLNEAHRDAVDTIIKLTLK
ncbi:alpha-L-fucosidase [Leeuwenhoekiella aestuarii]|uniref:alpha-L-fucosidase n=1 Tax=Leeuwenhoekiella aestuarii TaxID=2249426 RepID=A0A4Q0NPX1_9FLAO|nr:alpha-L-fucosidase [Leeuwenhoekiella aestuarii]RXG11942.1 alpha-L-fucosidase [Leeuwenhoekiella aestuarii]RXG13500.1 alpha-L-fucosidase [Leeuwenhoekiella aestuarii]